MEGVQARGTGSKHTMFVALQAELVLAQCTCDCVTLSLVTGASASCIADTVQLSNTAGMFGSAECVQVEGVDGCTETLGPVSNKKSTSRPVAVVQFSLAVPLHSLLLISSGLSGWR